ncbi:hypothetical protein [Scatolibacter rhodanostii]|uniref:hypothetical protein n=1 Tax=Scatolibacter rhodanostii TaxID=2014781 RepID=UPI000C0686A0|nr:hypothetical protein [Scatolibacter rhodanostii]
MDTFLVILPRKLKLFLPVFAVLCFGAGLLLFPEPIKIAVSNSLLYCLKVLVPTLFPFVALSSYAVHSGAASSFGKVLGLGTKYLFRLPKIATSTLILGFIGGYPSGAAGISSLLKSGYITKKQAGRMLLFCINPGVAFVVSFLGAGLLKNGQVGLFLFIAVTVSGILLGMVTAFFDKIPQDIDTTTKQHAKSNNGNAIVLAASDAAKSMVKMCAAILLFSAFYSFLEGIGVIRMFSLWLSQLLHTSYYHSSGLLSMLFEIAAGVSKAVTYASPSLFYAFALAFAGFCVHFQVFSFFEEFPLSKLKFILFRFIHGFISAFLFSVLQRIFPQTSSVFQNTGQAVQSGGITMSAASGFFLLLMCIAFLLISSKTQLQKKE